MLVQVGIRPENIMIAGNHQPETIYRPPPHIVSTTSSSAEPRSSHYTPTAPPSSIPNSASAFPRSSASSRQSTSYHTPTSSSTATAQTPTTPAPVPAPPSTTATSSSYTNSATGGYSSSHHSTQPAHDSRQYSHYPTDTTSSSSSSSSIQEPESRTMSPSRSRRSSQGSPPPPQPQTIRLRDIAHITELSRDDPRLQPRSPGRRTRGSEGRRKYDISSMPVTDVIEMVARLLTKITQTNDRTHQEMHRSIQNQDGSSGINGASSSILAFHGKNVPSITIHSYLSRIHKYCPTSYEVFLSLLVYFDRMTEKVNQNAADWRQGRSRSGSTVAPSQLPSLHQPQQQQQQQQQQQTSTSTSGNVNTTGESTISGLSVSDAYNMSHFFVVDSFNIHRLVIAGVTCASKFFSDIFYTNSRYAKVGGLPLAELNHLELQFLILNDFRLAVPVEELEAYGTMLVQFYAREAIANTNLHTGLLQGGSSNGSSSHDGTGAALQPSTTGN